VITWNRPFVYLRETLRVLRGKTPYEVNHNGHEGFHKEHKEY